MRICTFRSLAFACLASGLLLTTSCKRDSDASPDEDITSAEDRSEANIETAVSADAAQMAGPTSPDVSGSAYATADADFHARFGACATRTYDYSARTLTIDFGPTNCPCPDGRLRRGKILVQFTTDGLTRRAGAVVTRVGYFVNDNQHTATRTFTDTGSGSFTVAVTGASIIKADGGGIHSWTANWTFTRTAGFGTPQVSDDVYSVTGSANGTNRKGQEYTTTIDKPLVKSATCLKYYTSGSVNITNSKGRTMVLDYGNGACDNTATVTVNGRTKTITLR